MVITQEKSKRTQTGSRYKKAKKKRKHEIGRQPTLTKIGKKHIKKVRTPGGNQKPKLLKAEYANVLDQKTKKSSKAKITAVLENPANSNVVRRGMLTNSTIVQTDKGKAKITSRPGQD